MKKFLRILFTILLVCICGAILTACGSCGSCVGCGNSNGSDGGEEGNSNNIPGHIHEYTSQIIEPTCTEKGYTKYTCYCGDSYIDNEINKLGHNYKNWTSNGNGTHSGECVNDVSHKETQNCSGGQATCTQKAFCSFCGSQYGQMLEHEYINRKYDEIAHWNECVCGEKYAEEEHTFINGLCDCGAKRTVSEGLKYKLINNDTEYEIIGKGTCKDKHIIIPSTYKDKPVTSIKEEAFWLEYSLISIEIPSSIVNIGALAFDACENLTRIDVHADNQYYKSIEGKLYTKDGKTLIKYVGNSSETSYVIPEGVTLIEQKAFSGSSKLKDIEIPDTVTSIGTQAFFQCSSLGYNIKDNLRYLGNGTNPYLVLIDTVDDSITSATISDKCGYIYENAFAGCTRLTSLHIPDSVFYIGWHAFYNCGAESVTFGTNSRLTKIENAVFYAARLTSIEIPSGVTYIGENAFASSSLSTIKIPSSVTYIGALAFYNTPLTSIEIPQGVTAINASTFSYCRRLTSVKISSSVTSIGNDAFETCDLLTSIEIPSSVTRIGEKAFYSCTKLNNITFSGTVEQWNDIDKGLDWNFITAATYVQCVGGKVNL